MRLGATGLSGILGRSLRARLSGAHWVPFTGDVGDPKAVSSWYAEAGPLDAIFHLAAVVPLRQVESDLPRAVRTNVEGTCNVLDAVAKAGAGRRRPWVFLASTSHVYKSGSGPLAEDFPLGPANAYGRTKLQAEEWANFYAAAHGIDVCIGRIFSYSSPDQPESFFLPAIVRKITGAPAGARLEIPGIHGTRDFLTPELICRAFEAFLEKRAVGVYNIGTGSALKLLEIVAEVQARAGRRDLVVVPRHEGTLHLCADVSKLRGLGVDLRFDLPELVDRMIRRAGAKEP